MSLSPVAFIAPNYRDYTGRYIKFYQPGTTTPKTIFLDADGVTSAAKVQINIDGFIVSAGGSIVVPYVSGSYDAYIFLTEADADANDTTGATRIADDITGSASDIQTLDNTSLIAASGLSIGDKLLCDRYAPAGPFLADLIYNIVAGGTGIANSGTYFDLDNGNQAELVIDVNVNIKKFGATGLISDSAQSQFDAMKTGLLTASNINFEAGTYKGSFLSYDNELLGQGSNTILLGEAIDGNALTLGAHLPYWDYKAVRNLTVDGNGKISNCISMDDANVFAGRWFFDNIVLTDGNCGYITNAGSIGNSFRHTLFSNLNFGIFAKGTAGAMDTGQLHFYDCEFDSCVNAAVYINDEYDGTGDCAIRDSVIQECGGFAAFIKYTAASALITPFTMKNVWVEAVATSATVTIEGVNYTPKDVRFEGVRPAVIQETPLTTIELIDSTVIMQNCKHDDGNKPISVEVDSTSILYIENHYGNGAMAEGGFVKSIAYQGNTTNKNLSARGPLKVRAIPLANVSNATNIISNSFSGAGPWAFTGTVGNNVLSVSDGVLYDSCGELTIPTGNTVISDINGVPTNGKYVVWSIHTKLVSGAISTSAVGYNCTLGSVYLRTGQWVCSYGIQKMSLAAELRLNFVNTSGSPAVVRLADFFAVEFTSFQEAYEFVNSGYAIENVI
jgi:hypothetical protein